MKPILSFCAGLIVLACMSFSLPANAEPELILHGFRAPSTGVELRDGWIGFHVGFYPTTIDRGSEGPRTTWFVKTGLAAYWAQFDTGSGRMSGFYSGVSLVQGLNHEWNVSQSTKHGAGMVVESGFSWAVYRGLELRLGAAWLVGFDGRMRVNPTPGIGWAIPLGR